MCKEWHQRLKEMILYVSIYYHINMSILWIAKCFHDKNKNRCDIIMIITIKQCIFSVKKINLQMSHTSGSRPSLLT